MDDKEIIDNSKDQLNRLLTFFSRVDTQSSVLLTVNIGMLGFLAANSLPLHKFTGPIGFFVALPVSLIAGSLWNLYRGAFPQLTGGHKSLVYFREIAKRSE